MSFAAIAAALGIGSGAAATGAVATGIGAGLAGAAGTGIGAGLAGAATTGIGAGLGGGLAAAGGLGIGGGLAGAGGLLAGLGSGARNSGIGAGLSPEGFTPAIANAGGGGFGMKDIAKLAIKEFTPFGDILEKGFTKESMSNTAVQMAKSKIQGDKDKQPAPINISNSYQGSSPNIQPVVGSGGNQSPTFSSGQSTPSMFQLQQMLETKKKYASGSLFGGN